VTGRVLEDWDSIPERGREFSLRHYVQIDTEGYPASYPVHKKGSFLGMKRELENPLLRLIKRGHRPSV
jgi:hypothetical protein